MEFILTTRSWVRVGVHSVVVRPLLKPSASGFWDVTAFLCHEDLWWWGPNILAKAYGVTFGSLYIIKQDRFEQNYQHYDLEMCYCKQNKCVKKYSCKSNTYVYESKRFACCWAKSFGQCLHWTKKGLLVTALLQSFQFPVCCLMISTLTRFFQMA